MQDITRYLRSSQKWDRQYQRQVIKAIMMRSPTKEIGKQRIEKYLSERCSYKFNLANSYSRSIFRRTLLEAASELESELFQTGRVVMMATFVDKHWAFPDCRIEFDFASAKQKIRNALAGMDYIGAFEPAVYPNERIKAENGSGALVSFHAHVLVWSTSIARLRRHKLKIEARFTPLEADDCSYPVLNNLEDMRDFMRVLRYTTKMPVEGYEKIRAESRVRQQHVDLSPQDFYRLVNFLRKHQLFDAWFAGGSGSKLLRTARLNAVNSASKRAANHAEDEHEIYGEEWRPPEMKLRPYPMGMLRGFPATEAE